jgi:hypothetical protein
MKGTTNKCEEEPKHWQNNVTHSKSYISQYVISIVHFYNFNKIYASINFKDYAYWIYVSIIIKKFVGMSPEMNDIFLQSNGSFVALIKISISPQNLTM